ncbi:MAG TPA: methyltransferase domain-containing protein [Planctomycetota bacterium]|nr:methyltransferase domain-containing protein [Planctomycetota bacterium]
MGPVETLLLPHGGRAESVPTPLDAAVLEDASVVLLDSRALDFLVKEGEGAVAALETAVRRGTGLVVTGRAAGALPGSARYTRLLARAAPGPAREADASKSGPAALDVLDQSHPVTQCVTALFLDLEPGPAEGAAEVTALARTVRGKNEARTVLWTREAGRGRVAVLAVEAGSGPKDVPPQDPLSFLVARALQWASWGQVTVRVPDSLPLAAERLGAGDAGIIPGEPAREGFYKGREIAPVMGHEAAGWLLRANREETELPEKVIESLAIPKGSTVADVGAGAGYFSLRLARRLGTAGKVLATDVQEEMLALLARRCEAEGVTNVERILATAVDPRLPEGAVDLALLVDVYHELSRPAETIGAIRTSLKPRTEKEGPGRLVLVEYRGEDPLVPIKPLHRTTVGQMRAEIEPMGFRLVELKSFLPHQHILVFERK